MDITTESFLLSLLVAYFIPLVSAFFARQHWPSEVEGLLTTVIAVATAFIQELIQNPHGYSFTGAGLHAAIIWIVAFFARNQTWASNSDGSGGKITARLLAFPRKLPPGGVQPGAEPEHIDDAA